MSQTARKFFSIEASQYDAATEAAFFSSLKMNNGTFKTTGSSRFSDTEETLGPPLKARSKQIRNVLDVGASSGITTLEFAEFLERQEIDAQLVATDLYINAHIVSPLPGVHVLTDSQGWPLQYDVNQKVVRAWTRRLDYVTLRILPSVVARHFAKTVARRRIAQGQTRQVKLVSPRLGQKRNVTLVEDDIMRGNPDFKGRFDLVRIANILNVDYFSKDDLACAIANVASYLSGPKALVFVIRTKPDIGNNGTLLERTESGGFDVLARIGRGSEIEAMFLS